MGCFSSKEQANFHAPHRKKDARNLPIQVDQDLVIRSRLLNAVKRRDPILFEKAIQQYEVRCLETMGSSEEQRTLLHYIAEHNFAEGMSLALEYIIQLRINDAFKIINCKDSQGNTPLMVCCIFNSGETAEVLVKYDKFIDHNVRNGSGKTALDIALDNECPFSNLLQPGGFGIGSTAIGSTHFNQFPASPTSQLIPKLASNRDDEILTPTSTRDSGTLKSVTILTKDKSNFETTKLSQLMRNLEEAGNHFIDEEFPHDVFSMVDETLVQNLTEKFSVLKWEKSAQFLAGHEDIKIFEGIELNDVSQSLILGCDLYSALAAMVEFPQRLLKIFTTKETNKQGAYSVNFFIAGIPVEILLDDYFPCVQNSQLLFSTPMKNEIWFLILEKAFAKLYGNYMEVPNVYISEAFEIMTGMPSSQHPLRDAKEDDLWGRMMEYDKKNYIVCAGTYQKTTYGNRIFPVGRLYEVDNLKIIKLMNPFGDFEWNGNYSQNSPKWTKHISEELGYYQGEKSCFYMDLKEFIETFDFLSVCHYHDNWIRNGKEALAAPGKSVFFELKVEKEMDVFISVHQKLPRFVNESPDYDISPVEIILAEETHNKKLKGIEFGEKDALLGKNTVYASDKIKIRLSEGTYVLRTKIRWTDGMPHEFALNTFSPYPIQVKEVSKEAYPDFLKNIYIDAGERFSDKFTLSNKCEFGSSWAGPHLWIYCSNSGDKKWNLDIKFENLKNLKICKKYAKGDDTLGLVIGPNEKLVTCVKRINSEAVELRWKFQQSWN